MINTAPIAMIAQSRADGMTGVLFWLPLLITVTVGVGIVCVGTIMVVGGACVVVVAEVTTGADSVVKKPTVQAEVVVPLTERTLHQYWVLYFKVSRKGVALVGVVAL